MKTTINKLIYKNFTLILFLFIFSGNNYIKAQTENKTQNDTLSNVQAYLYGNIPSKIKLPEEPLEEYNQRMQWWKDAKYGMFIHFGLYSMLGGEYNGKVTPKLAEWIQNTLKIPLKEYKKLMKSFNPQSFNAKLWVKLAKDSGMKYIVITAKHHDGFALFNSKVSEYNIMNTPFHKDIIKALKEECLKQGIRFGIYYSHMIDWDSPNNYIGNSQELRERMNTTDFDPNKMNRSLYLKNKAYPQLKELLSNYGKIDIIWYDMGQGLTNNEVRKFVQITHNLQPQIIISSRIGDFPKIKDINRDMLFDYYTPSDNYCTGDTLNMPWEMAGTTNSSWGYRKDDNSWRNANFIINSLFSCISRRGNYILNVGPDGNGKIPDEATKQLLIAGKWINKNQEAIYGTKYSPFPWNYNWGYITQKPHHLYLCIMNKDSSNIILTGLKSHIQKAYILENNRNVKFSQNDNEVNIIRPKDNKDSIGYVIALQLDTKIPKINSEIIQYKNSSIRLDRICGKYDECNKIISWDFHIKSPGKYLIEIITNEKGAHKNPQWDGSEQEGCIEICHKIYPIRLKKDSERINPTLFFYKEITSKVTTINFEKAGTYTLHLKGFKIAPEKWTKGLALDRILLKPIKSQN